MGAYLLEISFGVEAYRLGTYSKGGELIESSWYCRQHVKYVFMMYVKFAMCTSELCYLEKIRTVCQQKDKRQVLPMKCFPRECDAPYALPLRNGHGR